MSFDIMIHEQQPHEHPVERPEGMNPAGDVESNDDVTALLHQWVGGDVVAGDRLFAAVYEQLRGVARRQRQRWRGEETLDTTALVHEVYLRMSGATNFTVLDRAHFYAVAARATRQILSNYARRARAGKRGHDAGVVSLDRVDGIAAAEGTSAGVALDRLWDLETALQELQTLHQRPCRVVECRYFGGLSIPDTALALGISEATVKRDWALAQAWLYRALQQHAPDHD